MKLGVFLLFSLLSTNFVRSKPFQAKDEEIESASKDIEDAEEFVESLLSNLGKIATDENLLDNLEFFLRFVQEIIQFEPIGAIEIVERLSEIEELIHQATEIQTNGDELTEVLKKMKQVEKVVIKQKRLQKTEAISSVNVVVVCMNSIKNIVNANPDIFTELILQDADSFFEVLLRRPKYLKYLIKTGYPEIIENLWAAELAVESIKSAYPSETEQLKRIIRDIEAKLFSLKRETKKNAMILQIDKHLFKHPENSENLINLRNDILRNKVVDRVYKRNEILNEDQQEELTDKIIPLTDLLDSVTDEFIEETKIAVTIFKSEFPEQSSKMDGFFGKFRSAFNNYIINGKTIAAKIKLDTDEGVRTNPLYIEMFSRFLEGKYADVRLNLWRIFKSIEDSIPIDEEEEDEKSNESFTTPKILLGKMSDKSKALLNFVNHYRSQPGPFDQFRDEARPYFHDFSPGLFKWENAFSTYAGM